MREYFMKTKRLGFSKWKGTDLGLALQVWGEEEVTRFICADGRFTKQEISHRLKTEIFNEKYFHIQYWPIFELETGEFVGCCGVRPFEMGKNTYELGCHLRKKYWGLGYASEAGKAVIEYSFSVLKVDKLYAGHHPSNQASKKFLAKLGFQFIGKNYYEPTKLYHPSYELLNQKQ